MQVIMCQKMRCRSMRVGVPRTLRKCGGKRNIIAYFVAQLVDVVTVMCWPMRRECPCLFEDKSSFETNRLDDYSA